MRHKLFLRKNFILNLLTIQKKILAYSEYKALGNQSVLFMLCADRLKIANLLFIVKLVERRGATIYIEFKI